MNFSELLRLIEVDGWYQVRQVGSHRQYHHPGKKGTVTLAFHKASNEVLPKTLKSVLTQAQLER